MIKSGATVLIVMWKSLTEIIGIHTVFMITTGALDVLQNTSHILRQVLLSLIFVIVDLNAVTWIFHISIAIHLWYKQTKNKVYDAIDVVAASTMDMVWKVSGYISDGNNKHGDTMSGRTLMFVCVAAACLLHGELEATSTS